MPDFSFTIPFPAALVNAALSVTTFVLLRTIYRIVTGKG